MGSNIPPLSHDEIVRYDEHSKSGWKQMVRPEPNNVTLMTGLVHKFPNPRQLVLDPFVSAPSTAKVYWFTSTAVSLDVTRIFNDCRSG